MESRQSICHRERYLWHGHFRQTCIRPVHLCGIAAPPVHIILMHFPLMRSQLLRVPPPRFPLLQRPCLRLDARYIPTFRTGLHDSSAVELKPKCLRLWLSWHSFFSSHVRQNHQNVNFGQRDPLAVSIPKSVYFLSIVYVLQNQLDIIRFLHLWPRLAPRCRRRCPGNAPSRVRRSTLA